MWKNVECEHQCVNVVMFSHEFIIYFFSLAPKHRPVYTSIVFRNTKMPRQFERKCEICQRKHFNDRLLGPLMHTKTISAHFNCVLYSPVTPDALDLQTREEEDAIGGVKSRFVRAEAGRAKKLVIFWDSFSVSQTFSKFINTIFFCRFVSTARQREQILAVAMILEMTSKLNFVANDIT